MKNELKLFKMQLHYSQVLTLDDVLSNCVFLLCAQCAYICDTNTLTTPFLNLSGYFYISSRFSLPKNPSEIETAQQRFMLSIFLLFLMFFFFFVNEKAMNEKFL